MEIPVLNRISGLETDITRLQNPSLISFAIRVQTFWTWGALIFALLAYFSSVFSRIKLVFFRFQKGRSVISQPLQQQQQQLYEEDDDEESEDETWSSSSSSSIVSSDDDEEDDVRGQYDEDFRVAGRSNFSEIVVGPSRSFSWSDFVNGKSVVKSWDGLGLGESLISLWDLNKNEITSSFSGGKGQIPALTLPSPSVIVSAGLETSRNVALRVFDMRVGRQFPQIFAEWQPCQFNLKGCHSVVVRDIRKITSPVENITESDVETWWDTDAVIVDGNQEFGGSVSVVSRCRNAVLGYLF